MDGILVIDVGTTGVRAVVVSPEAEIVAQEYTEMLPVTPADGIVEHDARALVEAGRQVAMAVLDESGISSQDVVGVGIAVQRATTVVWDSGTGRPVGPAIGWQDLRTLGDCLQLAAQGHPVAPNMSATKVVWLMRQAEEAGIDLNALRFGTLDTWLAWELTGRAVHVTDPTNACVTGLVDRTGLDWDAEVLAALGIPETMLPEIVPSAAVCGAARIGDRDYPLAARVGDQQASLIGQGGLRTGVVKTTYGTAAMTDVNVGTEPLTPEGFRAYPIVAVQTPDTTYYGLEATVITAGETIRALTDLNVARSPEEASRLAASVGNAGGVQFVPAGLGLGSPHWDYGARSAFVGMTLSTGAAELCRAVLEGVAGRVTECVQRIEADAGLELRELHADGGAAAADVLLQAQADQLGRPVLRTAEREATALGAGLLAGLATDVFDEDMLAGLRHVERTFEPTWDDARRGEHAARWQAALDAAKSWVPELSAIDFFPKPTG